MKIATKAIFVLLLVFSIFISGCGEEVVTKEHEQTRITCDNGRIVFDENDCDKELIVPEAVPAIPEGLEVEPIVENIDSTGSSVGSEEEAEEVFLDYIENNGYDYTFLEVNKEEVSGKTYYKVTYRYYKPYEGRRHIYIGTDGNIDELMDIA